MAAVEERWVVWPHPSWVQLAPQGVVVVEAAAVGTHCPHGCWHLRRAKVVVPVVDVAEGWGAPAQHQLAPHCSQALVALASALAPCWLDLRSFTVRCVCGWRAWLECLHGRAHKTHRVALLAELYLHSRPPCKEYKQPQTH